MGPETEPEVIRWHRPRNSQGSERVKMLFDLLPEQEIAIVHDGIDFLNNIRESGVHTLLISVETADDYSLDLTGKAANAVGNLAPVLILSGTSLSAKAKSAFFTAGADDVIDLETGSECLKARITMAMRLGKTRHELSVLLENFDEQVTERVIDIKERDENFRQFADNINEVFWMSTPYGNEIIYVSPAYEKIWGRSCQNLYDQPKTYFEAIHPEDRERIRSKIGAMLYGSFNEEYRIIRPDGEVRWIRARAFPVKDQFGKLSRIVGIADDISKRKQAEEELAKERKRVSSFLDIAESLIVGINRDMTVSIVNRKTCEVLEYSEQEMTDINWFETFIPGEEREVVTQVFQRLINGEIEPMKHFNNRIVSKSGHIIMIRWNNTYLRDSNGAIYATLSSGEIIESTGPADQTSQAG